MIPLADKTNTDPPSATWPSGDVNDNTGGNNGTPVNRELVSDALQFFEKIMVESATTPSGNLDNAVNGFQLYEAFRKLAGPYKVYTATMTQTGTNAPTVTILHNTIGNIVWTRTAEGNYIGTLTGAFPVGKAFGINTVSSVGSVVSMVPQGSADTFRIQTGTGNPSSGSLAFADGRLSNTAIEIRVYD